MTRNLDSQRFTLNSVFRNIKASLASRSMPLLIAAPLVGATFCIAPGAHAQISLSAATSTGSAVTPVAPIAAPEAARTGRPKAKVKWATGRAANPSEVTDPIAPIAAPDAARTGRPKVREKTATNGRTANPASTNEPAVTTPIAPIAAPEAARTGKPKGRDKLATGRVAKPISTAAPIAPIAVPDAARTGRPKEKVKTPMDTSRTVAPETTQTPTAKKRRGPKERDDPVYSTKL